jgi:prepilin-type N-terminal cleavage/methylation domain-containing protein
MRNSNNAERGFTALEMAISTVIAGSLLAGALTLTATMRRGSNAATSRNTLTSRAAEVTDRLARELTVSSIHGEDVDGDNVLDADEDLNRNARLDADWNVADGASVSDFSYNVREHETWAFGGRIRWMVSGGSLIRNDDSGPLEIARGVTSFTVTRSGDEVTVALSLTAKDGNGEMQTESSERRVYVRN